MQEEGGYKRPDGWRQNEKEGGRSKVNMKKKEERGRRLQEA